MRQPVMLRPDQVATMSGPNAGAKIDRQDDSNAQIRDTPKHSNQAYQSPEGTR